MPRRFPDPRPPAPPWLEFASRRDGMIHAMDGGLWLHRHVWKGTRMAHLVSVDRARLLAYGRTIGIADTRLQYKPLKDPRTGERRDAWHWDLVGRHLPPPGPVVSVHRGVDDAADAPRAAGTR